MKKNTECFGMKRFVHGLILLIISVSGLSGQLSMSGGCIPNPMDRQEGSRICIPVQVNGFTKVGAIQLKFNYNQLIFKPDTVIAGSYNPFNIGPGIFNINEPGEIRLLSIINQEVDFKADDTLFIICGTLIGGPGDVVNIQPDRGFIDIQKEGKIIEGKDINFNMCPIEITPKNNAVTSVLKICGISSAGSRDGSINIRGIGGDGPYTFSVSLNAAVIHAGSFTRDTTISNLAGGNYAITITDRNGNSDRKTRNVINERISLKDFVVGPLSTGVAQPLCPTGVVGTNHQTGRISVSGIKPIQYDFTWSNNLFNQGPATSVAGLEAGSYTLTITEPNTGCSIDTTFTLVAPDYRVGPVEVLDRFTCYDAGIEPRIRIPVTGGTAPYRYRTMDIRNQNSANRTLSTDGIIPVGRITSETKSISIIDANNCEFRIPLIDNTGNNLIARDSYALNLSTINLNCFSDSVFSTVLRVVNTTGSRSDQRIYSITNLTTNEKDTLGIPKKPETDFREFKAGNYKVNTATFDQKCKDSFYFSVVKPTEVIHVLSIEQPSCSDTLGMIKVESSGGDSPFIYKWSHDSTLTVSSIDSISRGSYRIIAKDERNCNVLDTTISIIPSKLLSLDSLRILKNIECGKPGTITAFASFPNARYSWSNGSTQSTINPSEPGTYTVSVQTDNCTVIESIEIRETSNFNVELKAPINALCSSGPGSKSGSIEIGRITGGAGQIARSWFKEGQQAEIAQNVNEVNNLSPGNYRLKVRDSIGCVKEVFFDIAAEIDTVKVNLNTESLTSIKCQGRNNGQAEASASGGTGSDYIIRWSSGSRGSKVTDLSAGKNWVVASNQGCFSDTTYFNIAEESTIEVFKNVNNPSCPEARDGKGTVEISGNAEDYDILWISIQRTGSTVDTLGLGNYPVAIRNKNDVDCIIIDTIKITETGEFKIGIDSSITRLSGCGGGIPVGQVGLRVIKGAGPVNYTLNGNILTGGIAKGLSSGTYNFIGVNNKGCADTIKNFELIQSQPVSAQVANIDSIKCNGGKTCIRLTNVQGGTGKGYTWAVNFSKNLPIDSCFEAFAGRYRINVFDSEGCTDSLTLTIGQPERFEINLGEDIVYQLGGQKPVINVIPSEGSSIIKVNWSDPSFLDCKNDNCQEVEVKQYGNTELIADAVNQNGCMARARVKLTLNEKENVFIPSVLKTDGSVLDFENTRWKITLGEGVESVRTLKILDRWGNVVYTGENLDNNFEGWDGKYNGKDLPPGVYVFVAEIQFVKIEETAKTNMYSGSITLIR